MVTVLNTVADAGRYVEMNTVIGSPPLCPEIRLRLLRDDAPLKEGCPVSGGQPHLFAQDGPRPYWAFAWAAGQALARFILDGPALVRGTRVADIGAGSGICAIAAALAGAASVTAFDCDPVAVRAIEMNAQLNGVTVDVRHADMAACAEEEWDVLLAADAFYHSPECQWVLDLAGGRLVLFGDPLFRGFPKDHCDELACLQAKTYPDLETWTTEAQVLRLKQRIERCR